MNGAEEKIIRESLGLSKAEMARELHVSVQTIMSWERDSNSSKELRIKTSDAIEFLSEEAQVIKERQIVKIGFHSKITSKLKRLSFLREIISIYYLTKDENVPMAVKVLGWGALAYFITPIDAIPDLIPGTGFLDDGGVIAAVLTQIQTYLTDEHRAKAQEMIDKL